MKRGLFVAFLILASVTIGYLLGQHKTKDVSKGEKELINHFDEMIKRHIEESKKIEKEIFDSMFSDKFFSRDYNPFEEIEKFRKRILSILSNDKDIDIFNDSFSKWFNDKIILNNIPVDGFEVKTYENDEKYIVEIENKDEKNSNLSIEVKPDYIKISYEKKEISSNENNNPKISSSSYINSVKYFSLPPNVRGKEYNVEKKDKKIIISFEKK